MSKPKDQFADLFSSYAPKRNDDSRMSLAERQRNSPMGSTTQKNNSQWADFDYLENSRGSSRSATAQGTPALFSQSATPVNNNTTTDLFEGFDAVNKTSRSSLQNSTSQSHSSPYEDRFEGFTSPDPSSTNLNNQSSNRNEIDLLDSFGDDFSSSSVSKSSTPRLMENSQPVQSQSEQNIDDLFAVFDRPPQPKPTKLENPIPTHSSQQFDVLNSGVASPQSFQDESFPSPTLSTQQRGRKSTPTVNGEARDEAIASLVDMGFSVEQATDALNHTDNGLNVEAAVSYIMNSAHQKARSKAGLPPERLSRTSSGQRGGSAMKQANQYFESFAQTMFKVSDKLANDVANRFFSPPPGDDGTPAWMRDQEKYKSRRTKYEEDPEELTEEDIQRLNLTNEGSKLEGPKMSSKNYQRAPVPPPRKSHVSERSQPQVRERRQPKPTVSEPELQEEIDIFAPLPQASKPNTPSLSSSQRVKSSSAGEMMTSSSRRRPVASRPQSSSANKTQRPTISMSSIEKDTFEEFRERGGVSFKQGDFATALEHYEKSLNALPKGHILSILAYSNCITAYFKVGENKKVVESADIALGLIGPSRGVSEEVEPGKNMKDFWVKITQKKAEALEHLEKFKEALEVWTELIENGSANKVTLDGKRRCQDALNPKPKETPKPKPVERKPKPNPKPSSAESEGEALKRIRESNQASQNFEEEKYKLYDQIESKINNWKGGKEDNLRALLASLHEILWESTNWKRVNLSDLVMPKKVKITYMKAVAKVHPDKIPPNATAEQKMIAQSVFVVINTAWEKFKVANNIQ
ncbi:hypothetical protein WICANDRAFT_63351 [Wickerhamomyces anomalus NRRL Y-366-8]|uniref:UBA domain-containing protein n=1 Tax=Wickerhamomyces anomalus (strain ATCC 58044 / CBS 1984 / NCYC 433 / NRRL Y-366-8) TaxID=683960 RepID=A0A1E3P068_WICAA|nr:uncharacterized protein WICANDRAFT_63351 [Wickerhamomyces anomalus NRRL Y-366-8]ODQ58846.1 hypothetical protein WICANDRAFT_63351 [Wickerhamomyces anomalus NRRL Y-366-8]